MKYEKIEVNKVSFCISESIPKLQMFLISKIMMSNNPNGLHETKCQYF